MLTRLMGTLRGSSGSTQDSLNSTTESFPESLDLDFRTPPHVAVIGAGHLGLRIITELLLVGSEVAVFDQGIAKIPGEGRAQAELDSKVQETLAQCARLMSLADLTLAHVGRPRFFKSVAEASRNASIILEAVPDSIDIKSRVFAEAMSTARPGTLLATNTLSIPLAHLQEAVSRELRARKLGGQPRVVGLRFLWPVVFIPFAEVTLTKKQQQSSADGKDLLEVLRIWGKAACVCDQSFAVDGTVERSSPFEGRFLLDSKTALDRQVGEARLRGALRRGPEAVAALKPSDLFDFAGNESCCCVCFEAAPVVSSMLCGHTALCNECATMVERGTKQCPICRKRFIRKAEDLCAS
eukprot:TRINITY_DN9338_c0_g1_i1.p1 TRINITY_DN9338_c0_g1~~TRINITY_DN9338_c0_g1_i1.p1  ORF type:complete len:353 (-),score=54.68 TRINITY_DN9338_c0_g1_i1:169-1227(-)